jgi:folate-dependent phosphoribosylglycinamide formyltransferase PurN
MKIVILCKASLSTDLLLARLSQRQNCELVVIRESAIPALAIIKFRRRRLGWLATLGQVAFMAIVPRLNASATKRRVNALIAAHAMSCETPPGFKIEHVDSINDPVVIERLKAESPDVVLVSGTRIIKPNVLYAISAPFINTHAGITPQYRGVHGGYWALYNNDLQNFGSTIHLVDKGVDTGQVLAHVRSAPELEDTFWTYPIVQFLATLPVMDKILDDLPAALIATPEITSDISSRQWFHPTLWQYVLGRLRGVK